MDAKSLVIPNQVNTDYFMPADRVPDKPPFRLFALAHLTAEKGMDVLIRAMQLLLQQADCACRLRIGGEGKERKRLEQMTRDAGLTAYIHFTGRLSQEEVRQEMQQAHAFVHPSLMESFGIVLLEAMACGLPVIATRSGGPEQIIRPELGLLCERDNAQALAHSIQGLKSNYHAYVADHIRAHIISHYGTRAISRQYLEVYQRILKQ
jgi:L-malate glycosyltransferase